MNKFVKACFVWFNSSLNDTIGESWSGHKGRKREENNKSWISLFPERQWFVKFCSFRNFDKLLDRFISLETKIRFFPWVSKVWKAKLENRQNNERRKRPMKQDIEDNEPSSGHRNFFLSLSENSKTEACPLFWSGWGDPLVFKASNFVTPESAKGTA